MQRPNTSPQLAQLAEDFTRALHLRGNLLKAVGEFVRIKPSFAQLQQNGLRICGDRPERLTEVLGQPHRCIQAHFTLAHLLFGEPLLSDVDRSADDALDLAACIVQCFAACRKPTNGTTTETPADFLGTQLRDAATHDVFEVVLGCLLVLVGGQVPKESAVQLRCAVAADIFTRFVDTNDAPECVRHEDDSTDDTEDGGHEIAFVFERLGSLREALLRRGTARVALALLELTHVAPPCLTTRDSPRTCGDIVASEEARQSLQLIDLQPGSDLLHLVRYVVGQSSPGGENSGAFAARGIQGMAGILNTRPGVASNHPRDFWKATA
jgi:hypothetical protein